MRTDYGDNRLSLRLAIRPFVDAFRFRGRSTRTEVVSFWLLGVASQLIHFAGSGAPSDAARLLGVMWLLAWSWPWIPLLVRRLHDQDRRGYWAWLNAAIALLFTALWRFAPTGDGVNLSVDWGLLRTSRTIGVTPATIAVLIAELMIAIALLMFLLVPGSKGANRYGPNPRPAPEPQLIPAET